MNRYILSFLASVGFSLVLVLATVVFASTNVTAQCTVLANGLERPIGITQAQKGNLLVSEGGTTTPNTGRISLVDFGVRQTLVAGLPSGINAATNEPSGPTGLFFFQRTRTLYVAIGEGDTLITGPPGTFLPNPNPSSPIFSSVLAIQFSSNLTETAGFTLLPSHHQALANGEVVSFSNGGNDRVTIKLVANFPDFTPNPLGSAPPLSLNVRNTNPFDLVMVGRHDTEGPDRCPADRLYVTDGGQNLVWQVDVESGAFSILAVFPPIPNPLAPLVGQLLEAVPTGIAHSDNQLLVTLFRGAPFPPGTSVVERVDPLTGNHTPFITGLKTAIDVLPISNAGDTDYLVLQNASAGPFFGGPGLLLRFETPAGPPAVVASCLNRPTSMTRNEKTGTLYVTELLTGNVVAISVAP